MSSLVVLADYHTRPESTEGENTFHRPWPCECRQTGADSIFSSTRLTTAAAPFGLSYPPTPSYSSANLSNQYAHPNQPAFPPSRSNSDLSYGPGQSNPYRRNSGSYDPHTSPSGYIQTQHPHAHRSSGLAYDDDEPPAPMYTRSPEPDSRDPRGAGYGYRSR